MHAGITPPITDRIHAGIDDVLAVDTDELNDRELCSANVELYRAEARLAAAKAKLAGALDARAAYHHTGAQSAGAYLGHACRMPVGVARHQVRVARALRHLPATRAALADGDISFWHASRIARHWENQRVRELLVRDEHILVAEAARLQFALFERVLAYWAQLADPDGTDEDAEARKARRRLHCSRTFNGSFKLDGLLDPVGGTILDEALRRIEQELYDEDRREAQERTGVAEPCAGTFRRNPAQRRADALVELARRAMATPAGSRLPVPLVSILCGFETFAGRVCELADGTVIAPGDVAALLDQAVIERAVFDGPSRVTDISHQRLFKGALRRAIQLRDRTCTHPYCDQPAHRCDIDHIHPAQTGGPTTHDNGRVYCPFHNHLRQHRPDLDDEP